MANTGQLLFGRLPPFPAVWILGLLGFIGFWWYVCRDVPAVLRLLVRRDPTIMPMVRWLPTSGVDAIYAMVVGGAVAALSTLALQLVGLLVGAVVGLVPSERLNPPRQPLPGRRPGRPAGNASRR